MTLSPSQAPAQPTASLAPHDNSEYVFSLVHGTWARGWPLFGRRKYAAWTEDDRPAFVTLRQRFAQCRIERPVWAGGNTFRARRLAAGQLGEHIRKVGDTYPGSRHYIIAHSHGGTIALQALKDPELAPRIAGVVCLATPFPHLRRRSDTFVRLLGVIPVVLTVSIAANVAFAVLGLNPLSSWALARVGVVMLLSALLGLLIPFDRYLRAAARFIERHTCPDARPFPLLVVRHPGDEASGALTTSHTMGHFASRATIALVACLATLALLALVAVASGRLDDPGGLLLALMNVGLSAASILVILVAIVTASIVPFDFGAIVYSPAVAISSEPSPPGSCEIHQMPAIDKSFGHSVVCTHTPTLELLCDWIRRARPAPRP